MPLGDFGNLIALPLQGRARSRGNSVFVDNVLRPYEDQWAFLASVRPMEPAAVTARALGAEAGHRLLRRTAPTPRRIAAGLPR